MKADPAKGHVCMPGMCACVCVCFVALKAIYGQYFCLATGLDCMTNATSRPSAEALHFIMATEISNRNRSGDTTYTTNIRVYKSKQMSTAAVAGNRAELPGLPCQFQELLTLALARVAKVAAQPQHKG